MIFQKHKHIVPGLNTTSTADISFMLLIFFLVTTSMDTDKGLLRQLPPADTHKEQQETDVEKGALMAFKITAQDKLMLDNAEISYDEVTPRVETFVEHRGKRHLISIEADAQASYNAYFHLQNALMKAYEKVRNKAAATEYGKPYNQLTEAQRNKVKDQWPQRIAETCQSSEEGGAQ
ncbi:MAG: biopolymer transporter ExbD [Prevotella sp.]|jgi:biopolymer transport protein ExbD|nr:biopolymer transporter ExbD [Prevotella sp.]MCI1282045.1 biopolymer transporter ExbD [Prevotella sp.]